MTREQGFHAEPPRRGEGEVENLLRVSASPREISSFVFLVVILAVLPGLAGAAAPNLPAIDRAAAEKIGFRHDVWPVLKRHCLACHTGASPKGGLRLDTVADMLKGGESGPLFTPGKPDESLLVQMIAGETPEMPKKQPPLKPERITLLRGWVLAGAKDDSTVDPTGGTTGEPVPQIPASYQFAPAVTSVSLSPDGQQIAAACRSELVLIATDSDTPPRRLPTRCDLLTHVEFSPDGSLVAAAGGSPARFGEVRFYRTSDGTVAAERRVSSDTLFRGSFAPDGKAIALGGADGAVYIVPIDPTAEVRRLELHSDWVLDAAYSPDGKLLITGGRDKATKVTSLESGKLIRAIDASTDLVSSVAASEQFAVSAGRARQLIGYEFKTALEGIEVTGGGNDTRPVSKRDQYAKPFEAQAGEVFDLATSADRKLLAACNTSGEVRVYRIADRQRVATAMIQTPPVYAVALSSDGGQLVVGTASGLVEFYELPAGKLLRSFKPVPIAEVVVAR
jgi:WD40 repeat protein